MIIKRTAPTLLSLSKFAPPLIWVICSIILQPSYGQDSEYTNQSITTARHLARALVEDANLPGLSISIGSQNKLIWSEGFGYADIEQKVSVTPSARFRIGSVSKTLTATAVGILLERGAMDLDIPIQSYIPEFPLKKWPVSLRQVSGHTAGIRGYKGNEFYSTKHYKTQLEALSIFSDEPLVFQPDTDYQYTTYGWSLVSAAIEKIANEPFLAFMDREVFQPLKMKNTIADHTAIIIPNRVRFYERNRNNQLINTPFVDNSNKWAGGGFLATTDDLVRFGLAHFDEGLLQKKTLETLKEPHHLASGKKTDYGIGWQTRKGLHGRRILGHGGGSVGGTTAFFTWPDSSIIVSAATNITEDPGLALFAYALEEIFNPTIQNVHPNGKMIEGAFSFNLSTDEKNAPRENAKYMEGDILFERTTNGYRGWVGLTDSPYFGRIIWGHDAHDGTHLVATTSNGILHILLNNQNPAVTGHWIDNEGKKRINLQQKLP